MKRVTELRTSCPAAVKPLGITEGTRADELSLHRQLKAHRMHGEWFRPHPEVLEAVRLMESFPPLPARREAKPKPRPEPRPRQPRRTTSDRIDQSKPAFRVVQKGGGLTAFCTDYDFPTSTVYSWVVRGLIPSRTRDTPEGPISYQGWILKKSEELGHGIVPEDFIEQPAAAVA